jgi:hypothetical protein
VFKLRLGKSQPLSNASDIFRLEKPFLPPDDRCGATLSLLSVFWRKEGLSTILATLMLDRDTDGSLPDSYIEWFENLPQLAITKGADLQNGILAHYFLLNETITARLRE